MPLQCFRLYDFATWKCFKPHLWQNCSHKYVRLLFTFAWRINRSSEVIIIQYTSSFKILTALDQRKVGYIWRTNESSKYCKKKFFSKKNDMLTYPKLKVSRSILNFFENFYSLNSSSSPALIMILFLTASKNKRSRSQMFRKIGDLKQFAIFTRKQLC